MTCQDVLHLHGQQHQWRMQFSREVHRSNRTTKESAPSWTITHHSYFIPVFCTTYSLLKDLSHHPLQCTQKDQRAIKKSYCIKRKGACFPSAGGKNNLSLSWLLLIIASSKWEINLISNLQPQISFPISIYEIPARASTCFSWDQPLTVIILAT